MKVALRFNLILITLLFLPVITQNVNATSYAWNQTPIQVNWTVIPINSGMTISDITRDGVGDAIYTLSGSTMTKQFGSSGVASFSIHAGQSGQGILAVKENRILAFNRGASCDVITITNTTQYNLLTGTAIYTLGLHATASTFNKLAGIINQNNQTGVFCAANTGPTTILTVHDSPNVNASFSSTAGVTYGPFTIHSVSGRVYTFENKFYSNATTTGSNYFYKTSLNLLRPATAFSIPTNVFIDNNIQLYSDGLRYPTKSFMTDTLLTSRLAMPINNTMSNIINLPPRILHTAFTTQPLYMQINDGTTTYFAAIAGTNLYYTDYNTLITQIQSNRAFQNYRIDPTGILITRSINATMPTQTLTIIFKNGTSFSYTAPVQTVLPSGYYMQIPTLTRYYYPDYSNNFIPMPIGAITGSFSILTAIAGNAPQDSAVMFTNSSLYNNTLSYVDTVTFLQADRSVAVSLRDNACHEIFITDNSLRTPNWQSQGILCNSGVMPKTIAFTKNLPLTFWTLQYGATHNFIPNTNILSTTTRSSTTPFTYNIVIKNSTGDVVTNNTYSNINATLDSRSFNVTGVAKPASLYISVGGNQIYSAFLGASVSLASVASFFHQYFSYQGFDLISFLPIIFAAMFTRNTVGIGTVLTVVCIATISWLSIVVIPDTYIFIMTVVAVIGLIGYRLAYPN